MFNPRKFLGVFLLFLLIIPHTLSSSNSSSVDSTQQHKVSGGIKANINLSYFIHRNIPNGNSVPNFGGSWGGFLNVSLAKGFSLQFELLGNLDRSRFTWYNNDIGKLNSMSEEVAIYAMYQWRFRKREYLHLGIGPYTVFGLYASLDHNGEYNNLYDRDPETDLPIFKDIYSGFSVMIGYEYYGWQVNAAYKMSYLNLLDENSNSAKLYPQTFTLGVAYCFRK